MFTSSAHTSTTGAHLPEYDHTQWAPMSWLFLLPALIALFAAALASGRAEVALPLLFGGASLALIAFTFRTLRTVDEGEWLAIRFGPIPLFRKRIRYDDIASAERDATKFIDGWGIHFAPGRGWTYNLWGFDCVRVAIKSGSTIRIGTDDPDALARFLNKKREP